MDKISLIGPYPPPDGGTTIPFKLFCDYIFRSYSSKYKLEIVRTITGDKSEKSAKRPSVIFKMILLLFRIFISCFTSQKIIIFGSQRFVTIIGSIVVVIFKPFGKYVAIRINGGAYDLFYQSSGFFIRFLITKILIKADSLVVQTDIVKDAMLDIWPTNLHKVTNYRIFDKIERSLRKHSQDEIIFIYTGIVRKLKGINELLSAYVILKERLMHENSAISIRLDIYGDIHSSKHDAIDVDKYRNISGVVFHGSVDNETINAIYNEADVFVFPTYWPTEGHSGSVVEAMMNALPVISTNWRAMPELIEDGVNGLLCDVKDANCLANKMHLLATNKELRSKLSMNSKVSSEKFNVEKVCLDFSSVFDL